MRDELNRPSTAASGTRAGGSRNRETIITGVVGTAEPGPISNSTKDASVKAATLAMNAPTGIVVGPLTNSQAISPTARVMANIDSTWRRWRGAEEPVGRPRASPMDEASWTTDCRSVWSSRVSPGFDACGKELHPLDLMTEGMERANLLETR